ncbi:MAG: stage 0 sporulation family protein [Clostridia bacterium]|nr:stage 0 sporulation family protein [Clostridia bacterium]
MREIVGVRFKELGRVYSFDPCGKIYKKNDEVIVETSRGLEYGYVAEGNYEIPDEEVVEPLKRVVRAATDEDCETLAKNKEKEAEALKICQEKVVEHNLEMKVIDVECTFDRSKLLFQFTADGRVDFRELVRDLASIFKTRIELRQVGVRDEARLLGGLGICGRPFCCSSFLDDFQPVSIKMAKEQNLSLNPTKISGTCGRLMCCLKYEQEAYEDLNRTTPRVDAAVETPDGPGTVVDVNLLRGKLKVRLDDSTELAPRVYDKCELCPKGKGCPKRIEEKEEEISTVAEPAEKVADESSEQKKPTFRRRRRHFPKKPNNNN